MDEAIFILVIIGGIFNLGFAIYHSTFWKVFRWKQELAKISRLNRNVVQIINLCLTYILLAMAFISFVYTRDLINTSFGNIILLIIFLFWFLRMIEQVLYFGFKNKMSIVFTLIFLLGSLLYLVPFILIKV